MASGFGDGITIYYQIKKNKLLACKIKGKMHFTQWTFFNVQIFFLLTLKFNKGSLQTFHFMWISSSVKNC